jgi:hypothetical protein
MGFERSTRPSPRERTFAELFPWRNVRRALMLIALIVAIVVAKRSMAPLLGRATELWGLPYQAPLQSPPQPRGYGVHLGPTLAPPSTAPGAPPSGPDPTPHLPDPR